MTIADDFLRNYQFAERHGVHVEAPAEAIFQAIDGLTDDDPIIRALIIVREAPPGWGFPPWQKTRLALAWVILRSLREAKAKSSTA